MEASPNLDLDAVAERIARRRDSFEPMPLTYIGIPFLMFIALILVVSSNAPLAHMTHNALLSVAILEVPLGAAQVLVARHAQRRYRERCVREARRALTWLNGVDPELIGLLEAVADGDGDHLGVCSVTDVISRWRSLAPVLGEDLTHRVMASSIRSSEPELAWDISTLMYDRSSTYVRPADVIEDVLESLLTRGSLSAAELRHATRLALAS